MKKFIAISTGLLIGTFAYATGTTTPIVRPGLMKDMRLKVQENVEKNKDIRNEIRTEKKENVKNIQSMREDMREHLKEMPMGSSTRIEKKEIRKVERKDEFLIKKNTLVKELTLAIENLTRAQKYIGDLITRETTAGKSLGSAQSLFEIAVKKIAIAKTAVIALTNWQPEAKTASSTEISLTKPREISTTAIKAVQEARKAIGDVIAELRNNAKNSTVTNN